MSGLDAGSRVVVVGASTAGRSAAVALRDAGYEGEVVLVGEEPHPPYDRPQLSKQYLRGDAGLDEVVAPMRLYPEQRVETRLGTRVRRVDLDGRRVELDGGETLGYDGLVLATGVRNRRLRVPGADLDGVLDLRDAASSDRLRELVRPGCRVVVVAWGSSAARSPRRSDTSAPRSPRSSPRRFRSGRASARSPAGSSRASTATTASTSGSARG